MRSPETLERGAISAAGESVWSLSRDSVYFSNFWASFGLMRSVRRPMNWLTVLLLGNLLGEALSVSGAVRNGRLVPRSAG